jgi:hypothetical protein
MIDTKINFDIEVPETDTYHLRFDNQRDLAQSMMRLQEYYEGASELIRGKYFTLEQFMHHFTDADGDFQYTSIWAGFNVPGNVVDEWRDLFAARDGLTNKEQQIMQRLDQIKDPSKPWYLIATSDQKDGATLRHEIAHARYHLSSTYRESCRSLIHRINKRDLARMHRWLIRMGYCEEVLDDETQAYLSTSSDAELKSRLGMLGKKTQDVVHDMRKLFKEYQA